MNPVCKTVTEECPKGEDMKFTIPAKELIRAMKIAWSWIDKRPHLPILSYVLITAKPNDSHIVVYNHVDCAVKIPIDAEVGTTGACLVKLGSFYDLVTRSKGDVAIEYNLVTQLTIKFDNAHFKVTVKPHDEFPLDMDLWYADDREMTGSGSIAISDIANPLNFALAATLKDLTKNYTNAVRFNCKDNQLTCIGTDGRRLHYFTIDAEIPDEGAFEFQLFADLAKRVLSTLSVENAILEFAIIEKDEKEYFSWRIGDITGYMLTNDSPFPEWEKVLPDEFTGSFEIDADDFRIGVEILLPIARECDGRDMLICECNGELRLSVRAESVGSGEAIMPCEHSGAAMKAAYNINYLLEILRLNKKKKIEVSYAGSLEPVRIATISEPTKSIIMPIRLPE